MIRSIHGDKRLERYVKDGGADATFVYTHRLVESNRVSDAVELLRERSVDSIVFTSSLLVEIIEDNLSKHSLSLADMSHEITVFSIGPSTSSKLREYNVKDFIEAYPHDSDGLYGVIKAYYRVG
jgi:uroporphyrinogen-III synthase